MSSVGTFFHEQLARLIDERTALLGATRPISLPYASAGPSRDLTENVER